MDIPLLAVLPSHLFILLNFFPIMTNIQENSTCDKDFFEKLPAVLEKARIDGGIPGMSVAIMYKGELVFAQGFGKRNRTDPFTQEV